MMNGLFRQAYRVEGLWAVSVLLIALTVVSCSSSNSNLEDSQTPAAQEPAVADIPQPVQEPRLPIPSDEESDNTLFAPLLMGDVLARSEALVDSDAGEENDTASTLLEGSEGHSHGGDLSSNSTVSPSEAPITEAPIIEAPSGIAVDSGAVELSDLLAQPVTIAGQITSSAELANSESLSTSLLTDDSFGEMVFSTIPLDLINQQSTNSSESSIPSDDDPIAATGTISTTGPISDIALGTISDTVAISNSGFISDVVGLQTIEPEEIRANRTVNVPILMYHYLSVPPADADIYRLDLSVKPEQFARHLDAMLDEGYTTISLFDLWRAFGEWSRIAGKPVVITFDDGYLDNYENAFPLLIQRGMTATFFIVTEFLESNRPGYFGWEMAKEMFDAGMSMESHGINHWSLQNRDDEF